MIWPQNHKMRSPRINYEKYTAVPKEMIITKKTIYFTAFRTLCGSQARLGKPKEEIDGAEDKIDGPGEPEKQQLIAATVVSCATRAKPSRPMRRVSKEVTMPINVYSPISFALRKKLLGQCLKVRPLLNSQKAVDDGVPTSKESVGDFEEKHRTGSVGETIKEVLENLDDEAKDSEMSPGEEPDEEFKKMRRWSSDGHEPVVAELVIRRSSKSFDDVGVGEVTKSNETIEELITIEVKRDSSQEIQVEIEGMASVNNEVAGGEMRRHSSFEITIEETRRISSTTEGEEIRRMSSEKMEESVLEEAERKSSQIPVVNANDDARKKSSAEEASNESGELEMKRKSSEMNGENERLAAAEKAIHKLIAPHGIGKVQTWIDRRPRGFKEVPSKKENPFGYEVKDTYQRKWPALLNGPPLMDNGWMGNTVVPTYTTTHRDTFQAENVPRNKCVFTPAVVRLGYGYLDALEKCYLTSYRDMFRHPESYPTRR